ncbi:MAG: hypothetical protein ABJN26_06155 [Stappiaceae bacterium]
MKTILTAVILLVANLYLPWSTASAQNNSWHFLGDKANFDYSLIGQQPPTCILDGIVSFHYRRNQLGLVIYSEKGDHVFDYPEIDVRFTPSETTYEFRFQKVGGTANGEKVYTSFLLDDPKRLPELVERIARESKIVVDAGPRELRGTLKGSAKPARAFMNCIKSKETTKTNKNESLQHVQSCEWSKRIWTSIDTDYLKSHNISYRFFLSGPGISSGTANLELFENEKLVWKAAFNYNCANRTGFCFFDLSSETSSDDTIRIETFKIDGIEYLALNDIFRLSAERIPISSQFSEIKWFGLDDAGEKNTAGLTVIPNHYYISGCAAE